LTPSVWKSEIKNVLYCKDVFKNILIAVANHKPFNSKLYTQNIEIETPT